MVGFLFVLFLLLFFAMMLTCRGGDMDLSGFVDDEDDDRPRSFL